MPARSAPHRDPCERNRPILAARPAPCDDSIQQRRGALPAVHQKLWLAVRKYPTSTKLSSTTAKAIPDRYAARRPLHPMALRANSANEYRPQDTSATRILGSASDIACARGSGDPLTCHAQMPPTTTPRVRKAQPTVMARLFIRSSDASDGSLV